MRAVEPLAGGVLSDDAGDNAEDPFVERNGYVGLDTLLAESFLGSPYVEETDSSKPFTISIISGLLDFSFSVNFPG